MKNIILYILRASLLNNGKLYEHSACLPQMLVPSQKGTLVQENVMKSSKAVKIRQNIANQIYRLTGRYNKYNE